MRSRWAILTVALLLPLVVTAPALAADAEDVATEVADNGIYVEVGTSASSARVSDVVAEVRAAGERLSVVVLADEPAGGATTFADAVFDRLGEGVVVVVTPLSVGWSGNTEVFTDTDIETALDASLDGQTDTEVIELFAENLLGVPVPGGTTVQDSGQPAAEPATTSSGGGGGSGWIWLLLIAGAVGVFFIWRSRRNRATGLRLDPRLAEAKQSVQRQIDALANDIIDMEEEVRLADNQPADDFYEQAGQTYGEVTDAFATANTPETLLELSNRLDLAIWQLDSAEAILDGKPAPPRPEPKRLPTPEASAPGGVPSSPGEPSAIPPRPEYGRRSTRRSSPMGGGLLEILIGVAGSMMAGRSRGGGSGLGGGGGLGGGLGGMLGGLGRSGRGTRVSTPQFPQVPSRSSGRSSPVPSPSRPGRGASAGSGTIGRGRGGGRRRRG